MKILKCSSRSYQCGGSCIGLKKTCYAGTGDLVSKEDIEKIIALAKAVGKDSIPAMFEERHMKSLNKKLAKAEKTGVLDLSPSHEDDQMSDEHLAELEPRIKAIKGVKSLTLSGNRFLTSIPKSLLGNEDLEELNISQMWSLKEIPKEIGGLSNLKTLNISGMRQLDRVPDEIGNLKNLKTLEMNRLSIDEIPDAVSRLTKLETLSFNKDVHRARGAKEGIRSLPEWIGNLKNLKTLEIDGNTNLKDLSGLRKLGNLRSFSMVACGYGTFPGQLTFMDKVEEIHLRGNGIRYVPDEIERMKSLKEVYIGGYGEPQVKTPSLLEASPHSGLYQVRKK